jgi:hypothetical protein
VCVAHTHHGDVWVALAVDGTVINKDDKEALGWMRGQMSRPIGRSSFFFFFPFFFKKEEEEEEEEEEKKGKDDEGEREEGGGRVLPSRRWRISTKKGKASRGGLPFSHVWHNWGESLWRNSREGEQGQEIGVENYCLELA